MTYKAVLFDMDGVLIESEELIAKCAILALADFGVHAKPDDFVPFVGCGEDRYIGGVAEKYGVTYDLAMKKRCYEYYGQFVADEAKRPERILELLETLKKRGYILAVCTSSDYMKASANLRAIGAREDIFAAFITGDEITNKKPDPEIYLKGAEMVGVAPEECIVVEDAPNGIQAAHAGGMKAIGVATSFSAETLTEQAGPDYLFSKVIDILSIL
ncbi:MAG: HAD-IA family hydrolase [Candidatus Choladocola sp.]|nr:HAD-IA family hydrolase [Candidatus Choladocola sp.]